MLYSDYRRLLPVELPFQNRQMYMHSVDLEEPAMAPGFEDYMDIVLTQCFGVGLYSGRVHMTVDEKIVRAGMAQRRPGPHVDGCFVPAAPGPSCKQCRGNLVKANGASCDCVLGYWGHNGGSGGWAHGCNHVALSSDRATDEPYQRMPVIVAASVRGCRAYRGLFDGEPKQDGDLAHIRPQLGAGEVLEANYGYLLSADCVHESMVFSEDTQRSFLRIALPTSFAGPWP